MKRLRWAHAVLMCGSVAACQSYEQPLPDIAVPAVSVNFSGRNPNMLTLTSTSIDMPAGKSLGESRFGWSGGCAEKRPITYMRGTTQVDSPLYADAFREAMTKAGIPVESSVKRFEGEETLKADLQVAAVIKDMRMNICYPNLREDKNLAHGEAYLEVEWSVFSPIERRVVYSGTTEGRTTGDVETRMGEGGVAQAAFRGALAALIAHPDFATAVLDRRKQQGAAPSDRQPMQQPPQRIGTIQDHIEQIRDGVVTVMSNEGEGSGFAVGDGRHIVTSAHVVSGGAFVKVIGPNGKTAYGEVVRKNLARDLALIKIEGAPFRPLHVNADRPRAGTEIYALGSPLGKTLEFSVTRGIVSGLRRFQDLDYLQSDVTVLPGSSGGPLLDASGNVVGVTQGGIAIQDAPVGVNFFVPASDIAAALSVNLESIR